MSDVQCELTVVVIDDEGIVRVSLCDQLEDMGYRVVPAENGVVGLEKIQQCQPDLILTDMRMPEMGGLEVIENSQKLVPDTPIIVISGAGRLADAVEALRLGAYDYLVKPIKDFAVLGHVVNKALEHRRLVEDNRRHQDHLEQLVQARTQELFTANRELSEHRQQLEETVKARTQALQISLNELTETQGHLIEAEKMASLGSLVAGVAHELNTPIGVCITAATFLQSGTDKLLGTFNDKKLSKEQLVQFFDTSSQSMEMINTSLHRASELIKSFKLVAVDVTIEEKRAFNVFEYLSTIKDTLHPEVMATQHKIHIEGDSELVIKHYPGILSQIMSHLMMNALQHAFVNRLKGSINIQVLTEGEHVHLIFSDNGSGMAQDVVEKIFNPFFNDHRSVGGSGLGLFIVYNLVTHSLNGKINCTSEPGAGCQFDITFPASAG